MIPQVQRETSDSTISNVPHWSLATKIGFRFTFSYLLLYIGPGAVGSLPSYLTPEQLEVKFGSRIWHPIVPWVGAHILGLSGNFTEVPNGSGDELYSYVLVFCLFLVAVLVTAIWSALDRGRPNYKHLYQWLRVFMRLVAAWAMLAYGAKKLVGSQFTPPDLLRLVQPIGQASPMGMLWTFMGASALYSFFGGFGETLGGVLLLFPRLTTLGALVSGAMMTNVMMLNLCYDVPRKIFSIHLVLMCLFLLIPDFRRLANVLVLNRPADPVPVEPLFDDKVLNRIALVAQVVFGAWVLWIASAQSIKDKRDIVATWPAPIRGVWTVNGFTEDGIIRPPLLTDSERWRNIVLDSPKLMTAIDMSGNRTRYYVEMDGSQHTAKVWELGDPHRNGVITLQFPNPNQMTFDGQLDGHQISAKMDRVDMADPEKYPLMNKGLHWVNPFIDNR